MSEDCIFCKIVKGEIPSYTLYEDDKIKVFLDINPVSRGHSLYIPKKHYKTIDEIPNEEMDFIQQLPTIVKKIKEATDATGINILQSNGKDAGQEIPHVHFHIIPRYPNDGIIKFPKQNKLEDSEAKKIIEKFKGI